MTEAANAKHPYYIVAPPYIRTSAGVKALHLLCDALNRAGQTATVLIYPYMAWKNNQIAPGLLTPILSREIVQNHFAEGLAPIMVYPETVKGNPFHTPSVVRYVLNYPGLLGGDKTYPPEELCYGYSKTLAEAAGVPENILFIPTSDTKIFYPPPPQQKRIGSCFYASKYRLSGGAPLPITKDSVEITRDKPDSLKPQEIADLFRRSEVFYTYENTALATEAVLCGCSAVFLPNPQLKGIIAQDELGMEGYAWGDSPAELARAKATVVQGIENYAKAQARFLRDLNRFIAVTQKHAAGRKYGRPVHVPGFIDTILFTIRQFGFLQFVKMAARKLYKICFGRK